MTKIIYTHTFVQLQELLSDDLSAVSLVHKYHPSLTFRIANSPHSLFRTSV